MLITIIIIIIFITGLPVFDVSGCLSIVALVTGCPSFVAVVLHSSPRVFNKPLRQCREFSTHRFRPR